MMVYDWFPMDFISCVADGLLLTCCRVIDGLDVLDILEKVPAAEKTYRPTRDITFKGTTIHANPFADAAAL